MSFIPPHFPSSRLLPVVGLCLAVPLLGLAQRGGPGTEAVQRARNQAQTQQQPPPATAQGAPGQRTGPRSDQLLSWEWWNDDAIKKEMRLTESQVRTITRIYSDRSRQMKPHSDELRKQIEALEQMTRERTVDVGTYSIQVTRVEALRTELNKTRSVMLYSFYRVLTPEQYDKLREIRDRRRSGRGGGGPR